MNGLKDEEICKDCMKLGVGASKARPGPAGLCLTRVLIKRHGQKPWSGHIHTAKKPLERKLLNRDTCVYICVVQCQESSSRAHTY